MGPNKLLFAVLGLVAVAIGIGLVIRNNSGPRSVTETPIIPLDDMPSLPAAKLVAPGEGA